MRMVNCQMRRNPCSNLQIIKLTISSNMIFNLNTLFACMTLHKKVLWPRIIAILTFVIFRENVVRCNAVRRRLLKMCFIGVFCTCLVRTRFKRSLKMLSTAFRRYNGHLDL